ncbi:tryptophan 2,3-dioxygenase [Kitasatospora sp. LaBMicrA B282]|uniref:tryptophan 2,3-dioxygenase n=1 Tax=Kitasatospora sp. LaBMicrA B282 TaxID=3420949 RepID=UPI003D0DE845
MINGTSVPEDTTDLAVFQGTSPYEDYVHASVLGSLQQPFTDAPDEMSFLISTQVMELWFALIIHEWRAACDAFAQEDLTAALDALERSRRAHLALNAGWTPLAALTPVRFNGFRAAFGKASGAQSARYRMMEFLLGEKSAGILEGHRGDPVEYTELSELLHAPSLWDEVLHFLHRRGHRMPAEVLQRDLRRPYQSDPGVVAAWRRIYAGPQHDPLLRLGELLTDIAELVQRWRFDHLLVVRRAMGAKQGSAGTSGLDWLERRARRQLFPELWAVRSDV